MISVLSSKSDAVRFLGETVDLLSVTDHHAYRATRAEMVVLHTRPMQRLIRLRQTGLGYMVWPNAENTRLSHSVGTTYWVARFLESLRCNAFSGHDDESANQEAMGNRQRLEAMDRLLGPDLSLDIVARLFALVHDFDLLPLGHTLQYQLGYFRRPGAAIDRARQCLQWVRDQLEDAPELMDPEARRPRSETVKCLHRHLDVVECTFGAGELLHGNDWTCRVPGPGEERLAAWMPALTFAYDLTHAVFSADLIDFSLRDSVAGSMPRHFDEQLLDYVCIFECPAPPAVQHVLEERDPTSSGASSVYRFGVNTVRDRLRHGVITAMGTLYRVRYEVAERIFYHDAKCAADAMLDSALRCVDMQGGHVRSRTGAFDEGRLLRIGDDEFLDLVHRLEREALLHPRGDGHPESGAERRHVMEELLSRRLFREIYRVSERDRLSETARPLIDRALEPDVRTSVERILLDSVPALTPSDLIFSSRPYEMQLKPPDMLVRWRGGRVTSLEEIAGEDGYGADILEISNRYAALWSLSVYLRPAALAHAAQVREACETFFGPAEDL